MSDSEQALAVLDIDELLVTHELEVRPARAPDHAAENHALGALASALARQPESVPQRLAELLRELCRAGSAGIAVPAPDGDAFQWAATTGLLAGASGLRLPRAGSPSGEAVARGEVLLLREPGRGFPVLPLDPPIVEMLLVPWDVGGEPLGTVWVASHDPACRFDAEDARLLRSLSSFAACAHRATRGRGWADEARRAEAAPASSEERFQALVKGFAQAVWEADADGMVRMMSPGWRELTGQGASEWQGAGWIAAVHPNDRHFIVRHWQEALAQGSPVNAEYRLRLPDGGWRWTNVRAAPLRNPDGSVARWIGMNIDVDARRQAEGALRESDGRFRVLAEASPALIYQFDDGGQLVYANRRCQDILGMQAGTLPEKVWGALLHPDEGPRYIERVLLAIATRAPFQQRVRARAADGRWHWFESHCAPLFGQGGAYRGHVGISIDVTEAVEAEDALRDADRRKDEFLATLAHELRNPLAPISNAVHLLRRPDGRRSADRMVEMVGRQVRQIVRLVDDLMDVSRITQGKLELRREPLSLAEILSMAVETSMPAIEAGRHELAVSLPEETLMLEADKVRLTQVFGNMLNNAAKYTDRGGRIWVGAWREGAQVVVSVRDTGIGIPPEQLPYVFEMFAQAHRDSARGQAGLGIGLTMVKSLIELHGGSVEARSDGPGRGSEFIVSLPLARVQQQEEQHGGGGGEALLAGRRVLVVDDNGDAAESLALLLHAVGAEVRTAHDGLAGLAQAAEFLPQAVLLDLGMPGMDGFEVARRLRGDARQAGLVIVALTGWGQEDDRRRTQAAGFDHHLTKPVDVDALLGILARAGVPG